MNAPTNNNFHINENGRVTRFCILQTVFTNEKKYTVCTILTRPQKVRPKKSNFGGRYFYVKIQL